MVLEPEVAAMAGPCGGRHEAQTKRSLLLLRVASHDASSDMVKVVPPTKWKVEPCIRHAGSW